MHLGFIAGFKLSQDYGFCVPKTHLFSFLELPPSSVLPGFISNVFPEKVPPAFTEGWE